MTLLIDCCVPGGLDDAAWQTVLAQSRLFPVLLPEQVDGDASPVTSGLGQAVWRHIPMLATDSPAAVEERIRCAWDGGAFRVLLDVPGVCLSSSTGAVDWRAWLIQMANVPATRDRLAIRVSAADACGMRQGSATTGIGIDKDGDRSLLSHIGCHVVWTLPASTAKAQMSAGDGIASIVPASRLWIEYSACLTGNDNDNSNEGDDDDNDENVNRVVSLVHWTLERAVKRWVKWLNTDRSDGLFTTIVADPSGIVLGVVYSSSESILESLRTGRGVYYSRSRQSIWRKGDSSGATQQLHRIDVDCDRDSLLFTVSQSGSGFCHLGSVSCFGDGNGFKALERTLLSRLHSPADQSYTNLLFNQPSLLEAKIREEASELCEAAEPNHIAAEAADLIYFALVKCVKAGVSLVDIERHLDQRALKVTRRPGHAKSAFMKPDSDGAHNGGLPSAVSSSCLLYARWSDLSDQERQLRLQRPIMNKSAIEGFVLPIIDQVKRQGDDALRLFTARFDRVQLGSVTLEPPYTELYLPGLTDEVRCAIDLAFDNIRAFHAAQLPDSELQVETMPGVNCSRFHRPIERVGLYIPGGSAVLPSTAMMLGIPAMVAGCPEIVLATPPKPDGTIAAEILYIAERIGAKRIVIAGGAQAIAALAYGTETVPKVDKIFGPGNQYVTAAKMLVQNDPGCLVSIDMPAGPSEVLVMADASAHPSFVASDLLSQAEHGPDSQVVLCVVGQDPGRQNLVDAIQAEIVRQKQVLPRRHIVDQCLSKSFVLGFDTVEEGIRYSNHYAPEHLILHVTQPRGVLDAIQNAGSIFLGPYTPESCGDYASGTNHTLPTYGYARMYSGVNTSSFLKHITCQEITAEGLAHGLGQAVMCLASVEGLDGHRNAVQTRLDHIRLRGTR